MNKMLLVLVILSLFFIACEPTQTAPQQSQSNIGGGGCSVSPLHEDSKLITIETNGGL